MTAGPPRLRKLGVEGDEAVALALAEHAREEERIREREREELERAARAERLRTRSVEERTALIARSREADSEIFRRISSSRGGRPGEAVGLGRREAALAAVGRGAELLSLGAGAEARSILERAAERAGEHASLLGRADPARPVLRAIAANLAARSEALGALVPRHGERLADRLERVAIATRHRAESLARQDRTDDATVLGAIATDSLAQAALVRAGAANLDALYGRGLLRALERMSGVELGQLPPGAEPTALSRARAFAALEAGLLSNRHALHDLVVLARPGDPEPHRARFARGDDLSRPEAALSLLIKQPLVRALIAPFLDLSRALSAGDAKAANLARGGILSELGPDRSAFEALLGRVSPSATDSAAAFVNDGLPLLLLRGILRGGLGALVHSSSSLPLAAWLKRIPGADLPSDRPSPAEKILGDLVRGRVDAPGSLEPRAWGATALGGAESLVLGTKGAYAELGTVSRYLHQHAIALQDLPGRATFLRADAEPARFNPLAPAGPHELGALVGPDGGVMVRTGAGPEWHQGSLIAADGERFYFDCDGANGFNRVTYTSAADPERALTRLDLDLGAVDAGGWSADRRGVPVEGELWLAPSLLDSATDDQDARVSLDDERPRKRRRRASLEESGQDLAAIVLRCPGPADGTLLGIAPRAAARSFAETLIDRLQREGACFEASWVERATDCATQTLLDALARLGVAAEAIAAVVLSVDAQGAQVLRAVTDREVPAPAFLPLDGSSPRSLSPGVDRLRDPRLVGEGVVLWPGAIDSIVVD